MNTKDPVFAQRLETLAAFLVALPEKNFNLHFWVVKPQEKEDCGFAGCAVGWACTIPEFQKAGLSLEQLGLGISRRIQPTYLRPGTTQRLTSWSAAECFFGLTCPEADALFSVFSYEPDEQKAVDVAQRIRRLLNGEDVACKSRIFGIPPSR